MSKDFSGRTVFITGSAQGIGLATATILASRGANLALADLQIAGVQKAADSLAKEYGVKTLPIQVDVTKPDQVKKVIAQTIEHFGSLDHAVNAAGVAGLKGAGATFSEYPVDDWNFVMNVNCNGVFYCCQAQVAAMLKAGTKGSIVNIASTAGVIAFPTQAAYVASKHAVIGMHLHSCSDGRHYTISSFGTCWKWNSDQCGPPRIYRHGFIDEFVK
jgi:meso-butanediol dehydrogenase / (S,S)-butanediol dehydrogenase / diacetyl reductase